MAKVRRTKIIIEEVVGEDDDSTKVFVNGDQFKEIDFTDEKKDNKEEKKKTTSTKEKTSSNKSSTSTKKKATSSKKKSTSSSKKKSTKSKTSSKKKTPSTSKKKDENIKEVQDNQSTSSIIELPLKEEKETNVKNDVSLISNKEPTFMEISDKLDDKARENNTPTTIEKNSVTLINQEDNKKEVIDNPDILDVEIKADNEVKVNSDKPETLEAEIIEKENENKEDSVNEEIKEDTSKEEKDDSSLKEKQIDISSENDKKEENESSDISTKENEDININLKKDQKEEIKKKSEESNDPSLKEKEIKEENTSTTYTVVESNENETKEENKKENSKLSKLLSTKGLILGGVILVALLATLIPISLNLQNDKSSTNLVEINKEDINQNNFISSSTFFDNLENLDLNIYDARNSSMVVNTSLDYSYLNDIYSYESTNTINYVEGSKRESILDKLIYNKDEDNYTFTTKVNGDSFDAKDQTTTYTKSQSKDMLQEVIITFYNNYLNIEGSSITTLIDDVTKKENSTLNYYYRKNNNNYLIKDTSGSLLINFDQYGIINSVQYASSGWCLPEQPSDPGMIYYKIDLSYSLK